MKKMVNFISEKNFLSCRTQRLILKMWMNSEAIPRKSDSIGWNGMESLLIESHILINETATQVNVKLRHLYHLDETSDSFTVQDFSSYRKHLGAFNFENCEIKIRLDIMSMSPT